MSSRNFSSQMGFLQHRAGDVIKARYEVLGRLGGGNFGSVYRVRDGVVGNFLACKEMHVLNDPRSQRDERALALDLFKREALNLATLRHPNIPAAYYEQEDGKWHVCPLCGLDYLSAVKCPVHGAELLEIEQRHYLMMDFIDGATLEELAIEYSKQRGRPLPETDCIEWMAQIASALRSLHKLGVVHRDIKPDNITIRASDNSAMLLDFGLTKKIEESGHYGTLRLSGTGRFGTPGYAPPDAEEQQNPEARSDIYALGMTLLRLLTGRDPQENDDLHDLQTHAPRHFNTRISPEIERILQRATAPKKAERYANVEEFLHELNELRPQESSTRNLPPFTFADGFRARTPKDLARAVDNYPRESLNYLWNGMLAEWLRQNGFAAPAAVAENVVAQFQEHPQRALEMFRRSLHTRKTRDVMPRLQLQPPTLNFGSIPSGAKKTLKIRVQNVGAGFSWGKVLVEQSQKAFNAHEELRNFQVALPGLSAPLEWDGNDATLEIALDATQAPLGGQSGALLFESDDETVRVPVSYTVEILPLVPLPTRLDFGNVALGTRETLKLSTRKLKTSDGEARGAISKNDLPDVEIPERFSGDVPFDVTIRADKTETVARAHEGVLHLDTNGGRLLVPISYRITMPARRFVSLVFGTGLQAALAFASLRLAYAALDGAHVVSWLWNPTSGAFPFQMRGFSSLVVGAILGLVAAFRVRNNARFAAMETALPFFGLLAGAFGGAIFAWLMHWGIWVFGDWLLWPLRFSGRGAGEIAPLSWALVGGAGGVLWGIARVMTAFGHKNARALAFVIFVLSFFALLLNAMLQTP